MLRVVFKNVVTVLDLSKNELLLKDSAYTYSKSSKNIDDWKIIFREFDIRSTIFSSIVRTIFK